MLLVQDAFQLRHRSIGWHRAPFAFHALQEAAQVVETKRVSQLFRGTATDTSGRPTGRISTFFQADAGTQQALRPSSNSQSAKPPFNAAAQSARQGEGVSLATAAAPSTTAFGRGLQASTLSDLNELDDLRLTDEVRLWCEKALATVSELARDEA